MDKRYTLSIRENIKKVLYKSKKMVCTNIISHDNNNKSNNLNTSNSDNVIGTSNLPYSNAHDDNPFNTPINLQKLIYTESSVSINDERKEQRNISEDILYYKKSVEIIDHACKGNAINLVNT